MSINQEFSSIPGLRIWRADGRPPLTEEELAANVRYAQYLAIPKNQREPEASEAEVTAEPAD